ncbi:apyrase [Agrilus planipennis]|uniref:Apyrase n=1 Tax=Agrilus planipennis TaxID=224129 RepID=A0A7F5R2P0_AGRPL|nr:apyrase [Agrilus planipennis]
MDINLDTVKFVIAICVITCHQDVARSAPTAGEIQHDFLLSVIHLNDFHARFEPISYKTLESCNSNVTECVGGFSRTFTLIDTLRKTRPNPIVLNAGDNFQGTIWYNIFKWNATLHFMNLLHLNASTLGNHEFDDGIGGIVPYMKGLNSPIIVSNIDDKKEAEFQGLYNKSTVLTVDGRRIGIIGAIVSTTKKISHPGNLIFLGESASVNREADRLIAEENVDTIIVLSHCGYDIDQEIAKNATQKISLIVGGHSHYFLYTGDKPPGPDKPVGDYPTVINHEDGRKILIVQASSFSKYLGNLTVYYNSNGNVVGWDGGPIFVDSSFPQDEKINRELDEWKSALDVYKTQVVGNTTVLLDLNKCWSGECNIGSMIADAMVWTYEQEFPEANQLSKYAPIGLINAGGIRSSIQKGNITYGNLLTVQPYSNTWDHGYIEGKYIVSAISKTIGKQLMQVSGLKAVYDFKNQSAHSVKVKCPTCPSGYEDINPDQQYLVIISSFFATGGDNLDEFAQNLNNHTVGPVDSESLVKYVRKHSPITQTVDGRIVAVNRVPKEWDLQNGSASALSSTSQPNTFRSTLYVIYCCIFIYLQY